MKKQKQNQDQTKFREDFRDAYNREDYVSKRDKQCQMAIHDLKFKPTIPSPPTTKKTKTPQKHTLV